MKSSQVFKDVVIDQMFERIAYEGIIIVPRWRMVRLFDQIKFSDGIMKKMNQKWDEFIKDVVKKEGANFKYSKLRFVQNKDNTRIIILMEYLLKENNVDKCDISDSPRVVDDLEDDDFDWNSL